MATENADGRLPVPGPSTVRTPRPDETSVMRSTESNRISGYLSRIPRAAMTATEYVRFRHRRRGAATLRPVNRPKPRSLHLRYLDGRRPLRQQRFV